MRIVLGAFSFARPGGTESYVLTVARELERLGHEVVIACEELGPFSDHAGSRGLTVAGTADQWPSQCDAVFAHDAIMTCTLAERYPAARLVYFAHSTVYDHQLPPLLPGLIDGIVVASDLVAERIRALALDVPIVRLKHPIDTERFIGGPIARRPRRALLLGNYLSGRRREALTEQWRRAGVECVQVGAPSEAQLDVVPAIDQADIVVAKARSALEGMSCGRAVYVYDHYGADGWVTPQNYEALEATNFAGVAGALPRGPGELAADLNGYSEDMGWMNRELVVKHHSARRHAEALVGVLRGPAAARSEAATLTTELARLARTGWIAQQRMLTAEQRVVSTQQERDRWCERALLAEEELDRLRRLLATRRVRAGIAVGRHMDSLRGGR